MKRYYFTFGPSEHFPYRNGWVEVLAGSMNQAIAIYRARFPDKDEGLVNCSDFYAEDIFKKTKMCAGGNYGHFCHMELSIVEREVS